MQSESRTLSLKTVSRLRPSCLRTALPWLPRPALSSDLPRLPHGWGHHCASLCLACRLDLVSLAVCAVPACGARRPSTGGPSLQDPPSLVHVVPACGTRRPSTRPVPLVGDSDTCQGGEVRPRQCCAHSPPASHVLTALFLRKLPTPPPCTPARAVCCEDRVTSMFGRPPYCDVP